MKHHIMNILKVYGRSLKRNNVIVIISFSTHLAFNICICYNASRQKNRLLLMYKKRNPNRGNCWDFFSF